MAPASGSKKKSSKASRSRSNSRDRDEALFDEDSIDNKNKKNDSPLPLLKQVAFFWMALVVVGLAVYLADMTQKVSSTPPPTSATTSDTAPPPPSPPPSVSPTPVVPEPKPKPDDTATNHPEQSERIDEPKPLDPPDPRIQKLWDLACDASANDYTGGEGDEEERQSSTATCHHSIQISGRSLRATQLISPDTLLLEIPRSMQIWDLDAYRDPFIRKYLFKASHIMNGNRLGTEAFLAAYLALEQKRSGENPSHFDPIRLAYLQSLPTIDELKVFHPVFQEKEQMKELLGARSSAFRRAQSYINMAQAEYDAFVAVSPQFMASVTKQQYYVARVNVMTRVIHVGPPGPEEVMPGTFIGDEFENEDLLQDELYSYSDVLGVNLTGCIALIPLADMLNHHSRANTEYVYHQRSNTQVSDRSGRSLIVSTTGSSGGIDVASEPMVSYGFFSDAELFARYGFVNGDGSGSTQISISYNHETLRLNISTPSPTQQYDYVNTNSGRIMMKFRNFHLRGVAKYFRYDDGYKECITGPTTHPFESELKKLKYEYLLRMANDYDRWNMYTPPRNMTAGPPKSIDIPIRTVPEYERHIYVEMEDQIHRLQETCRFMELINSDFEGRAIEVLRDNLDNPNFVIGPNVSDSLEFRSFMCLSRWFGTTVVSLEVQFALRNQYRRLKAMTDGKNVGNFNWTAQYVRFGEMEALQRAAGLVYERVSRDWEDKKYAPEIEYIMKDDTCPDEDQTHLFKEEEDSLSPEMSSLV
mmetsp:Transcript_46026/g.112381  ORF Transcript_46026/g.112381 Transcript_46026/m.112381 type:complete len:756 (+) Transcript_46026:145-2412(+)